MTDSLDRDAREIAANAERAFRSLDGVRVFITGGTGFVGTWLLRGMCAANDRLGVDLRAVVLTRDPQRFARDEPEIARRVELVAGDVRALPPISGAVDAIVHAAAETNVSGANPPPIRYFDVSVAGSTAMLELAAAKATRRLLYISSGAIYGADAFRTAGAREDDGAAPLTTDVRSAYGNAKRACEALIAASASGTSLDAVIARLFAFVGPGLPLDSGYAVGNFVRDAIARKPIDITGDGTPLRSYLYAADMSAWLWTLLAHGVAGTAYNVGSTRELSIAELAGRVVTVCGGGPVVLARMPEAGLRAGRYVPDTIRAQQLGLAEWTGLDEALHRTATWWQYRLAREVGPDLRKI